MTILTETRMSVLLLVVVVVVVVVVLLIVRPKCILAATHAAPW